MHELEGIERVIVLVDDLDRCLPEAVVAALEAIKLFLSVEKMSFVIAYDEDPVVEAVRVRYAASARSEAMARQYLEKIVQVPVRVPRLSEDGVRTYLALTLLTPLVAEADLAVLLEHADRRRRQGKTPLLEEHRVTFAEGAKAASRLAERLAPVLYGPLDGNPRRLKRFLNDYGMRSAMAQSRGVALDADALAKLMVLEQIHKEQFAELIRWSVEGIEQQRLGAIEGANYQGLESWAPPALKAWASLEPRLALLPLRPYLELAAGILAIPFAATGLPPELQRVLGELADPSVAIRKHGQQEARQLSAESRVALGLALIELLPRTSARQADLVEAIPDLVNGNDEVGKAIVTGLDKQDPAIFQPALMIWLSSANVPSTLGLVARVRNDARFPLATRTAAEPPKKAG
jgi:hypothetical protein